MRKFVFVLFAFAIAIPAVAADHPQKPGLWEMTMQMDMPDMPMKMPPIKHTICVTADDLKDPQKSVPQDTKNKCSVGDYKIDGNKVTWTIECSKPKMKGDGEATYTGDTFTATTHITMEGRGEMTVKYTGKWKGECTK
jgi:uncharacterized protein DUF3617